MAIQRGIDGSEPLRPEPIGTVGGTHEERRNTRTSVLARGTLACPECDAPVVPERALRPADAIGCPYCGRAGRVRDFLSLAAPTRPTHVVVKVRTDIVVQRARPTRRAARTGSDRLPAPSVAIRRYP